MDSYQDIVAVDCGWREARLIFAYLVPHNNGWALIETGPMTTVEHLLSEIRRHVSPTKPLTDIIVTHVHLDHAGAAARLQAVTDATIYVHERGKRHLESPEKLIAGARYVFGELFDAYWQEPIAAGGPVVGIEDGGLIALPGRNLSITYSPGHAMHHMSIYDQRSGVLFTGDVAGVRFGAATSARIPSVPNQFEPDLWLNSLNGIERLAPKALALTHGGLFTDIDVHLSGLREQLSRIVDLVTGSDDPVNALRSYWCDRLAPAEKELEGLYEQIMATDLCVLGIEDYCRKKKDAG